MRMRGSFVWVVVIVSLAIIAVAAYTYFKIPTDLYEEVSKTQSVHIDTSKPVNQKNGAPVPQGTSDRTLVNIFPYLAAPHER
jgi:hypothetical protein